MELHKIVAVTAADEPDVYFALADITDIAGERRTVVYASRPNDDFGLATAVRSAVLQWIDDGKPIAPYEPPLAPTPEEIRAAMPPLQKWRFETVVDLNGLREQIDAAIQNMPEPDRTVAFNKRNHVPDFYRNDPLFDALGPAL